MDKKLTKRLIALVLTGGILLSSTGVYTALATEETATSEYTSALVGSTDANKSPNSPNGVLLTDDVTEPSTEETATETQINKPEVEKPVSSSSPETTVPATSTTTSKQETTKAPNPNTPNNPNSSGSTTSNPNSQYTQVTVTDPVQNNQSSLDSNGDWLGIDGTINGAGTEANPYNVADVEDFLRMNKWINDPGNANKHFCLTANIDFSGVTLNAAAIQAQAAEAGGVYSLVSVDPALSNNANVYFVLTTKGLSANTLKNMTISVDGLGYVSVFGYLNSSSKIEDLFVNNLNITNTNSQAMAAGFVLKNEGSITGCNFDGITVDISKSTTTSESFMIANDSLRVYTGAAGIVVDNSGIIDLSELYDKDVLVKQLADVTIKSGRPYTGALVAQNRGYINKIRAIDISVTGTEYVGAIVGANMTARSSSSTGVYYIDLVSDSSRSTKIVGSDKVGGIVGFNKGRVQRSKITDVCKSSEIALTSANATIVLNSKGSAGGIVGFNEGDVQICSALNVGAYISSVENGATYGGIVGYSNYTVRNCVATGTTNGAGTLGDIDRYVGGIVGKAEGTNFSVQNCYTLVRILNSNAVLGAVVGFGGDDAYKSNRVKNVFYSSIISTRPSPVSYGAAGVKEGDLVFSKPYAVAYNDGFGMGNLSSNTVEIVTTQFNFSGWSTADFNVKGNFTVAGAPTNAVITKTATSMTYKLSSVGDKSKTHAFYDVDITLPAGVGFETSVLLGEQMEIGILNANASVGNNPTGARGSEIVIAGSDDIWMLGEAPAAHFTMSSAAAIVINDSAFEYPVTFWGTVDLKESNISYQATKPFFKGIYGSRDDSLSIYDSSTHTSSSADADDKADNLAYGVVKNFTLRLYTEGLEHNHSNLFGNICNATLKNINVVSTDKSVYATEANSGLFAKAIYGNSYLYGCYLAVYDATKEANNQLIYNTNNLDSVSGFIGTIDAENALIDNCGANVIVNQTLTGAKNSAVFVGKIKSLGGAIINSYATGGVRGTSLGANNFIFAGEISSNSTQIHNCYYSPADYYRSTGVYKGVTEGIRKGSFTGICKNYSFVAKNTNNNEYNDITMQIATGTTNVLINAVKNINRITFPAIADAPFLTDYFTLNSTNTTYLTTSNITRENDYPKVTYTFSGGQNTNANLIATHKDTGLTARLSVYNSSDLALDENGFYVIKTPIDLYYLVTNQTKMSANGEYLYVSPSAKIKIAADIDMTGYTIGSFGTLNLPFQGEIIGQKDDGTPATISNLSYDGYFPGFFQAVKGATISGIYLDNITSAGQSSAAALVNTVYGNVNISDCKVTNSTVSAPSKTGAIVGLIQSPGSNDTSTITSVIENCTVENTTVTSTTQKGAAQVGGIVGTIGQGSGNDNRSANIKKCTVNDCEITAYSYQVGGIVGYADHIDNTIEGCTVSNTDIYSTNKAISKNDAFLGGIAGSFGGKLIDNCIIDTVTVSGPGAAGVVTNLMNLDGTTSTISNCTIKNSNILAENVDFGKFAGGIMSIVSPATTYVYSGTGDKVVSNCKITQDTTVKSAVSGGIVANVDTFSGALTIENCTNLGTVETTGRRGSGTDAAGGIIGRISTLQSTNKINITGCLSQGTLKGVSILGGIIGVHSGATHSGENKLISNTYITTVFSSTSLSVTKGLIVGLLGTNNTDSNRVAISALASNVVYSSLSNKESLFGGDVKMPGDVEVRKAMVYDMQLGADQEKGLTIGIASSVTTTSALTRYFPYVAHSIVGYVDENTAPMGTNSIQLKTNFHTSSEIYDGFGSELKYKYGGTDYTIEKAAKLSSALFLPRLKVDNLPVCVDSNGDDFAHPASGVVFKTDTADTKLKLGTSNAYNKPSQIQVQTFDKKCQAVVYTTYSGTINGETVGFKVGFTVIVNGDHAFDGAGTRENPYIIRNAEDLLSIKMHHDNPSVINKTTGEKEDGAKYYAKDTYYEVVNDIDLSGDLSETLAFAPIGTKEEPFMATITSTNGQSFKISNVIINNPTDKSQYAYNTAYGENAEYSQAFGVFGYTDGATISNLEFENVSIVANPTGNDSPGLNVGSVVGYAENTIISNVKVSGVIDINVEKGASADISYSMSAGGVVGYAGTDTKLSDVSVIGADAGDGRAKITSLYAVGGIVGSTENATGVSITNARVENVNIENRATSGRSVAGGVAGIFTGTLTGSIVDEIHLDEENNPITIQVRKPVVVNNVTVKGNVVGGAVGTASEMKIISYVPEHRITMVDVSNVTLDVIRETNENITNGVAGGILGKTGDYYSTQVDDCTVDANTMILTGLTAGGIVGKFNGNATGHANIRSSLHITNCKSYAKINQEKAPKDDDKFVTYTADIVGVGGILGVATHGTYVMNENDNTANLKIHDSTAGGEVAGTYNVGGIAGQIASQRPAFKLEESMVYNCIMASKLVGNSQATRVGVIFGAVESDTKKPENTTEPQGVFPAPGMETAFGKAEYKVNPIDKVFYSSYTTANFSLYGISEINNYQGTEESPQNIFAATVYDINQVIFNYDANTELSIGIVSSQGGVLASAYQFIATGPVQTNDKGDKTGRYNFSKSFKENTLIPNGYNDETDTLFKFSLAGENFELIENGITSSNTSVFTLTPVEGNVNRPYKLQAVANDTADLVLTYTNGLQIGIPIICGVNYSGTGTEADPITISETDEAVFRYIVPLLPNYYFKQTGNLDFTDPAVSMYAEIQSNLTKTEQSVGVFGGNYDGGGFTINGLKIVGNDTDVQTSIFGTVAQVTDPETGELSSGTVKNVTFTNCTLVAPSENANVGLVAAEVKGNATIENVHVVDSTVTANGGNIGGFAGAITGPATLNNVSFTGTNADIPSTVTSTSGSVGGIAGEMSDETASITGPKVENVTIVSGDATSGSANKDIAGGIVAEAIGTINGVNEVDEDNNIIENEYADAVSNVKVQAFTSGGAVGATYRSEVASDNVFDLTLNNIKIANTDVIAKSADKTRTGMSASGLLGKMEISTNANLNNSYVKNDCTVVSDYAAGGAVGITPANKFGLLNIIDTECYAGIAVTQSDKGRSAYAGGMVGYINASADSEIDLNNITMNGSVAGGNIKAIGSKAYAGGAIGSINENVTTEVSSEFFINGVLSAEVAVEQGDNSGMPGITIVQRMAKFVAGYNNGNFPTGQTEFMSIFHDNYYSSYPQDISFFTTETGGTDETVYTNIIKGDISNVDVNTGSNLMLSKNEVDWSRAAILGNSDTQLFAKLNTNVIYGSADGTTVTKKISLADLTSVSIESGNGDVTLQEGSLNETDVDIFSFIAQPHNEGAGTLIVPYTCGLKTTAPIICVEMDGTGKADDPFLVRRVVHLYVVGSLGSQPGTYFRQVNDIDLSNSYNENGIDPDEYINNNGGKGFAPIGTATSKFQGNYDGQGYKITGMRMDRDKEDYVGLFGYTNNATIKNIHLELMSADGTKNEANGIVGNNFVGGIIGRADNTTIENCSVALGSVTGKDSVGGIIGTASDPKVKNCFTQSDVNAFGTGAATKPYAGGIIADIVSAGNGSYVKGCFASGSIYATPYGSTTDFSNAAGIVGYLDKATDFYISDCLFTGSTSGGYGILSNANGVAMNYTVSNCIDAGMNVAMGASNAFTSLDHKPVTNASAGVTFTEVYYDNALLKVNQANINALDNNIKGAMTSELISPTKFTNWDADWTTSAGFYPVPKVSNITVVAYDGATQTGSSTMADPYSQAYARFLSAPVQVSEKEEDNDSSTPGRGYGKGIVYPVTMLADIDTNKVTYSSSVFDTSDTVAYPEGYDTNLYGIGDNKNVDLLFEDKEGITTVYRNVFDTTINTVSKTENGTIINKNTRVNDGAANGTVFANGEAYYNTQVPMINAVATIGGIEVHREIKIPLSYGTTYPIATQRQLFALGKADNETSVPNSKFCNYYGDHYNYKLITDVDCSNSEVEFTPIGYGTPNGYTGQFDGSNHKIIGLTISKLDAGDNAVGMFATVSTDFNVAPRSDAFVKNLTLENCNVFGGNTVGTLVGYVKGSDVTIENCHVTGVADRTADGDIDSSTLNGVVQGSGQYLGGLIGRVDYPSDMITKCSATNAVFATGRAAAVGGLIGHSSGTIDSCYATGNVIVATLRPYQSGIEEPIINGVGGLIGVVKNVADGASTVKSSFASGNVEVRGFGGTVTREQNGVGGFIGYIDSIENSTPVVSQCFSGGNVEFGTADNKPVVKATISNATAMVGVGGFIGVTNSDIEYCYSSAAVTSEFGSISKTNGSYGLGTGGVVGIARDNVSDVYSSGSVSVTYTSEDGNGYNGIGGTIGTTMETSAEALRCYFDMWTNSNPNLTSVGGKDDSTNAGSLTTVELTSTQKPCEAWSNEGWGYAENAYPYLTSLLEGEVDADIKVNSILSVVCVNIDEDDVSAKQGLGVTMALTVPTTFKYSETESYTLNWTGATLKGNLATIERTRNTAEYVDVTATLEGYEENGSRVYRRLCADMRGTYEQPYLIGSLEDLEHVNMTQKELEDAIASKPELYGQWATPLGDGNNQIEGTVHYRLSGPIDANGSTRKIPSAPASYTFKYTEFDEDGVTPVEKTLEVPYAGFNLAGNAYTIDNVTSNGYYIANLDEKSTISNVIFDNLTFTSTENSALVSNNKGQLIDIYVRSTIGDGTKQIINAAGLVLTNIGTIDGCVVDITLKGASQNVGVMAVTNTGTIKNSGTAGTVTTVTGETVSNIGAFVVNNNGAISSCFSMADIDVLTEAGATLENISGFASTSSGTIENVYTRTALSVLNTPADSLTVSSLVGKLTNNTADAVKNSYAIGLLGYYNDNQDSIAFGTVPSDLSKLEGVFVDKAIAGEKSYKSFKYAASTESLMEMKQMPLNAIYDEKNNPEGAFVKGAEGTNTFPQLNVILKSENTAVVDPETKEPIEIENGTVIRNYDVIKAYSKMSSMSLKTAYGQYADRLASDSSNVTLHGADLRSQVSSNDEIYFKAHPESGVVSITNATGALTTAINPGKATLEAYYRTSIELTRGLKIEPKLYIDVQTITVTDDEPLNPNFGGGLGTSTKPYIINNADSLQSLTYYGSDSKLYYELGNDIDMNDYPFEQIPIFSGHLNEGSDSQYAIENLTSNTGGIFGKIEKNAVINNVAIAGANITSDSMYTGALADVIEGGKVTNCIVSADVTSTTNETGAATGVLVGLIKETSTVESVVTTGNANANVGAVGGIAGFAQDTVIKNVVSTANVPNLTAAGGIVGSLGEKATIDTAIYAGVALSKKPIVAIGGSDVSVINAYYDKQLTVIPAEEASAVIGTAKTTSQCADAFESNAAFTIELSHYPIPVGVANATENSSFAKTVDLATMNMIFYLGSSNGEVGYYTSMRFDNIEGMTVSEVIDASESDHQKHFNIELADDGKYTVRTAKYTAGHNPSIVITLPNGAARTIKPGLVLTANITYTVEDSIGLGTYSVLIKSVKDKGSLEDVNVINDFTTTKNTAVKLDSLIVSDNVKGFYVGDMLPKGYKYEISAKLNGEDITSRLTTEDGVYGTFVSLETQEGVDDTNVELTLKIVEETKPWGVQSKNSTLN